MAARQSATEEQGDEDGHEDDGATTVGSRSVWEMCLRIYLCVEEDGPVRHSIQLAKGYAGSPVSENFSSETV